MNENNNPFSEEFSKRLSNYINIDVAKVKKVPKDIVNSFLNVFNEKNKNAEVFNDESNTKFGILKLKKYRIVLFYVDNNEKIQCFVASEISEKRILNYIQFLRNK